MTQAAAPSLASAAPATARERMLRAKDAARGIALLGDGAKRDLLYAMADAIERDVDAVVEANRSDLARGRESGLSVSLQDRLTLDATRVTALAAAVREVADLPDPVGRVIEQRTLANGLALTKVAVPFGVVGSIYEARPNVTVDIAALALRSGNAVVLRGGTAAEETNAALVAAMREALAASGVDPDAIQTLDAFGREGAKELMQARGIVDLLVPRGSAQLIEAVVTESIVPVIETGAGVVHVYLDESAPIERSREIVVNAKAQRPSVCNAAETVLVHAGAADRIVGPVVAALQGAGVTVHGDETVARLATDIVPANESDWGTEYQSLDIAMRVVDDLDEALSHIRQYSTHHTESIITEDPASIDRFLAEVDSAVVMANASTRFTDGGEFGFGAEVGISTQKLHARGPMGLRELTSTKWIVRGDGQVRG